MNLRAVAHVFDGVAILKIVVVDVKGGTTFRDRSTTVFWDGDRAMANVVIDLDVFIILEGELDGEVGLDGIVMNVNALRLASFDTVVVEVGLGLVSRKRLLKISLSLSQKVKMPPPVMPPLSPGCPFSQRCPASMKRQSWSLSSRVS